MKKLFSIFCLIVFCWGLAVAAQPLSSGQQALMAKGYRFERAGWVYVHAEGTPEARGFQQGYLLAREIAEGLRITRIQWEHMSALPWSYYVQQADAILSTKIDAENRAELLGIVQGLEAAAVRSSFAELVAYNAQLEMFGYWWPQEYKKMKEGAKLPVPQSCSSFIAVGDWTKDRTIVLGHNTMQGYEGTFPNVVLDLVPDKGNRILWQTTAGWIHSGTDFFLTSAGLVGAETTIGGFEGFDPAGIPEFIRMRRATQDAAAIDAWCEIMKKGNNGGYANAWLLGDIKTGEIARLELGLKHIGFERTKNGYFVGSNIAENLRILRYETGSNEAEIRDSSVARRVRWKQLMAQHKGKIDAALARQFEAEHYDAFLEQQRPGGRDLCAHHELEREPAGPWPGVPYGPAGTVDGKVLDAAMAKAMSFSARWGAACGRAFDASSFLTARPQFEWMKEILRSRPSQPWVDFQSGERQTP